MAMTNPTRKRFALYKRWPHCDDTRTPSQDEEARWPTWKRAVMQETSLSIPNRPPFASPPQCPADEVMEARWQALPEAQDAPAARTGDATWRHKYLVFCDLTRNKYDAPGGEWLVMLVST